MDDNMVFSFEDEIVDKKKKESDTNRGHDQLGDNVPKYVEEAQKCAKEYWNTRNMNGIDISRNPIIKRFLNCNNEAKPDDMIALLKISRYYIGKGMDFSINGVDKLDMHDKNTMCYSDFYTWFCERHKDYDDPIWTIMEKVFNGWPPVLSYARFCNDILSSLSDAYDFDNEPDSSIKRDCLRVINFMKKKQYAICAFLVEDQELRSQLITLDKSNTENVNEFMLREIKAGLMSVYDENGSFIVIWADDKKDSVNLSGFASSDRGLYVLDEEDTAQCAADFINNNMDSVFSNTLEPFLDFCTLTVPELGLEGNPESS